MTPDIFFAIVMLLICAIIAHKCGHTGGTIRPQRSLRPCSPKPPMKRELCANPSRGERETNAGP